MESALHHKEKRVRYKQDFTGQQGEGMLSLSIISETACRLVLKVRVIG